MVGKEGRGERASGLDVWGQAGTPVVYNLIQTRFTNTKIQNTNTKRVDAFGQASTVVYNLVQTKTQIQIEWLYGAKLMYQRCTI